MISRRQAAARLGVSLGMMTRFEKLGDLRGVRDERGRVAYEEVLVEELRAARAARGEAAELVLDVQEDGSFVTRPLAPADPVEEYREKRYQREAELKERELVLRERELVMKNRAVDILAKSLPQLVKAVERGSWASVGGAVVGAIPEEQRAAIIAEVINMFKEK